jgi:hypothetical protein
MERGPEMISSKHFQIGMRVGAASGFQQIKIHVNAKRASTKKEQVRAL